jgi:hypothetical protein
VEIGAAFIGCGEARYASECRNDVTLQSVVHKGVRANHGRFHILGTILEKIGGILRADKLRINNFIVLGVLRS